MEEKILKMLAAKGEIRTRDIISRFKVSRQYANIKIRNLINNGKLIKVGSTHSAFYISPQKSVFLTKKVSRVLKNEGLEEDKIMHEIKVETPIINSLKDNIQSIFDYAFSEMLNNAIEHSTSEKIEIEVGKAKENLVFTVKDLGIGVFKNIMKKRGLKSETEAIQDLLKGKTTTAPLLHSGEGIFFTSKIADVFTIDSYGYRLTIDNLIKDIFLEEVPEMKGSQIYFQLSMSSKKHLGNIFRKFSSDPEDHAFDKTEIQIKLYTLGTIHISRSQARRVLTGLEKFKTIIFDFDKVPSVGQAFADEVFRVFQRKHPQIKLEAVNMNKAVEFMVNRVEKP